MKRFGFGLKAQDFLQKKTYHEVRNMIFLLTINGEKEGITGYQLQDIYDFPRGNILRGLAKLEELGAIEAKEEVVNGRTQKKYIITEQGKEYLKKLASEWSERQVILEAIIASGLDRIPGESEPFGGNESPIIPNEDYSHNFDF